MQRRDGAGFLAPYAVLDAHPSLVVELGSNLQLWLPGEKSFEHRHHKPAALKSDVGENKILTRVAEGRTRCGRSSNPTIAELTSRQHAPIDWFATLGVVLD
jgi:hypothetical protein